MESELQLANCVHKMCTTGDIHFYSLAVLCTSSAQRYTNMLILVHALLYDDRSIKEYIGRVFHCLYKLIHVNTAFSNTTVTSLYV